MIRQEKVYEGGGRWGPLGGFVEGDRDGSLSWGRGPWGGFSGGGKEAIETEMSEQNVVKINTADDVMLLNCP